MLRHPVAAPAAPREDHAAEQTSALLWLMFRALTGEADAATLRAAEAHMHLISANSHADPLLRRTCERLAAQWHGRLLH